MATLNFDDFSLDVGGRSFFREVTLEVAEGETLVVAGMPGCGKSFLLRAALCFPGMGDGEDVVWSGDVRVFDRSILLVGVGELQQLRIRIGSLFRGGGLIDNMDVRQNVALPIYYHFLRQIDAAAIEERCSLLLTDLGIEHLADGGRRPVSLNREERVTVGLARALIGDPALLLLDDPMVGLPPAAMANLKRQLFYEPDFTDGVDLTDRHGRSMTRVITAASLHAYLDCGDRFAVLNGGQLEVIGDRTDVCRSPEDYVHSLLEIQDSGVE